MSTATMTKINPTETGAPPIPEVVLPDLEPETIQRLGHLLLAVAHDPYTPSVVTRGAHLVEAKVATTEKIRDALQEASKVVAEHSGAEEIKGYQMPGRLTEKKPGQYASFGRFHLDGSMGNPVNEDPVDVNMNLTHVGGTHVLVGRAQPGAGQPLRTKKLLEEGKVDPTEIVPGSLAQTTLEPGDAIALVNSGSHHITGEDVGGTAHLFNVNPEAQARFTESTGYTASNPINREFPDEMM